MPPEANRTFDSSLSSVLSARFEHFYKNEIYCDVQIHTGDGGCIQAHKVVLSAASLFFERQFSPAWVSEKVTVPYSYPLMKNLMDYIYTGLIQINFENLPVLLEAQDFFVIGPLRPLLHYFMLTNVTIEHAALIVRETEKFNYADLHRLSSSFLKENFDEVLSSKWFLEMDIETLSSCLQSPLLRVRSDEFLFERICTWSTAKPDRAVQLISLLNLLDLTRITNWDSTQSKCIEILRNSVEGVHEEVQIWFSEAAGKRRSALGLHHYRVERKTSAINVLLAIGGLNSDSEPLSTVDCLISSVDTWRPLLKLSHSPCSESQHFVFKTMLKPRKLPVITSDGVNVVVAGGEEEQTIEHYSVLTNKWTQLHTLKEVSALALLNSVLYAVSDSYLWILNFNCNKWSKVTEYPFASSGKLFGAFESIFTVAYTSKGEPTMHIFRYDLNLNVWVALAPLPLGIDAIGCAFQQEELVFPDLKTVYSFNFVNKMWNMDIKRNHCTCTYPEELTRRRGGYCVTWGSRIVALDWDRRKCYWVSSGDGSGSPINLPKNEAGLASVRIYMNETPLI